MGETQVKSSSEDEVADGVPEDEVGVAKEVGGAEEPLDGAAVAFELTAACFGRAE